MSKPQTFLCRCEDVTLKEFRQAYGDGFTEMESLKRYTGVGTGFCQGKGCLSEAAFELADLRGEDPESIQLTVIRPPAEPLTFEELASLSVPDLVVRGETVCGGESGARLGAGETIDHTGENHPTHRPVTSAPSPEEEK